MSIHVTPNDDGTYTIACGTESIVIGNRSAIDAISQRRFPETNIGNGVGVSAFIVIHEETPQDRFWPQHEHAIGLESLNKIGYGGLNGMINKHPTAGSPYLDLTHAAQAGQTFDVASLMDSVEKLGVPSSTPVILGLRRTREY